MRLMMRMASFRGALAMKLIVQVMIPRDNIGQRVMMRCMDLKGVLHVSMIVRNALCRLLVCPLVCPLTSMTFVRKNPLRVRMRS